MRIWGRESIDAAAFRPVTPDELDEMAPEFTAKFKYSALRCLCGDVIADPRPMFMYGIVVRCIGGCGRRYRLRLEVS